MEEKIENTPIRGYYRMSKAWYAKALEPTEPVTIMIGMYYPEGGCAGELSITWHQLDNKMYPRLNAFDDAWKLLIDFKDLLKEMAKWEDKNITEEQFAKLLDKEGFTDLTPYQQDIKPRHQPRKIQSGLNKKFRR